MERSITSSPRTSVVAVDPSRLGIPSAIAFTSVVTSSPVLPSPRVTARASRPFS